MVNCCYNPIVQPTLSGCSANTGSPATSGVRNPTNTASSGSAQHSDSNSIWCHCYCPDVCMPKHVRLDTSKSVQTLSTPSKQVLGKAVCFFFFFFSGDHYKHQALCHTMMLNTLWHRFYYQALGVRAATCCYSSFCSINKLLGQTF